MRRPTSRVLFLTPYPHSEAPSQRFRFELFLESLQARGASVSVQSFLTPQSWKNLYVGSKIRRGMGIIDGYFRRIGHLSAAARHDVIFIHRELSPIGPPIFEWFIAKVLKKKIIYDFDDAIWLPDPNETNKLWQWLKWKPKVKSICQWSWKVSAGNEYLAAFARQYCNQVEVIPTVVDTEVHRPADERFFAGALNDGGEGDPGKGPRISAKNGDPGEGISTPTKAGDPGTGPGITKNKEQRTKITIGWTGSHTTLQYINPLIPLIRELEEKYNTAFLVIANKDPQLDLKNYRFIPWSREREVQDLWEMDIGIMPLSDDAWSQGKCGFKAIQYSAVGIPALVSPVGVNSKVVLEGKTGFVCGLSEAWRHRLIELIESPTLRQELGENGRRHMVAHYSVKSIEETFLSLLLD